MGNNLLEGEVLDVPDLREEVRVLRAKVRTLERQLSDAETGAQRVAEDAHRALTNLQRQLGPLYRALQMVFGELDAAGVREEASSNSTSAPVGPSGRDARETALWDDWKAKLPPPCGKVIDALLLHSDLTVKQLKVAARLGENSIYQATSRLGQAGLVSKNGGRFSLKQL